MAPKKTAKAEQNPTTPVELPEDETVAAGGETEQETPVVEAAPETLAEDATASEHPELGEETLTDLITSDEDDETIPVGEPETPAEEGVKTTEETAPVKEEASEEVKALSEEEKKAAAEEQAPTKEPVVEEPVPPTQTPEQQQEARVKWRADTEEALAVGHFALSDELAAELEDDPAKAVPKLMARLYLDAVENASATVMQLLPQVLERYQQNTSQADKARDDFFTVWDKLDPEEHKDALARIGTAYRTANPQATPEEFIRDVGAATMVALKIPHEETTTEEIVAQIPAHKPLGTGAAPVAGGPASSGNAFEQLAEEHLADDA